MTIGNAESIAARQLADATERVIEDVEQALAAILAPVERVTSAELDAADLAVIARCSGWGAGAS